MSPLHAPKHELIIGGQPMSRKVADQAADWLTLLMSDDVPSDAVQRLRAWRNVDPEHERAWQHVEAVTARFSQVDGQAGYTALSPYTGMESVGRRKVLNLMLWGGATGVAATLVTRTNIWRTAIADYRTQQGEQRQLVLSDGTQVLLNTASAINVRYDGRQRVVELLEGEILVVTGHKLNLGSSEQRPFVVQTLEGRIQALGTRFCVRQELAQTAVSVLESAVRIYPDGSPDTQLLLAEHKRTTFTRRAIDAPQPAAEQELAWMRGQIVADDMQLEDFLLELSRYRSGIIRCEPAVAHLRFSGVFPIADTDRILQTLPTVLPVTLRSITRYWVTVCARHDQSTG